MNKANVWLIWIVLVALSLPGVVHAQNWNNQPATKKARSEASALEYQGQVYVFNGFGPRIRIEPSIERFNPSNGQWSVIGNTSVAQGTAVTHNGLVRVGANAWIIGGRIGTHPGPVTSNVWIYNLNSGRFSAGPPLPVPSAGGGAAVVNNRIHWFGGLDPQANCDVNNHYVLNLANQAAGWQDISSVAAMPSPRNHFATVELGGKIYAIGGQFGHDNCAGPNGVDTNLVHVFNPQNNQWSRLANMPSVQSHTEPSTFAHNGQIYVVGGERGGNMILRYSPGANRWDTIGELPQRLLAPVARIFGDQFYVAGGGAPGTSTPTTVVQRANFNGSGFVEGSVTTGSSTPVTPVASPTPTPMPTAPTPTPATPPPAPFSGTAVVLAVEAENFDNRQSTASHQWVSSSFSGAVGSQSMVTSPDSGARTENNGPSLSYLLNFEQSGTYYVWIRGLGDAGFSGQSNSVHAGINGSQAASANNIDGFPPTWTWSNARRDGNRATLNIPSPGVHSISLHMREDGLAIDRIVLANDPAYRPSGGGPAAFEGTGDDGTNTITNTSSDSGSSLSIDGNRISWPNDGWYQVLDSTTFVAICNGGDSCTVEPGVYLVINHGNGERFENVRVGNVAEASSNNSNASDANTLTASDNPDFRLEGNTIQFIGSGWHQVQTANGASTLCAGESTCTVSPGRYIIINHSDDRRYENVQIPASLGDGVSDNGGSSVTASPVTVTGNRISWPPGDYYQVQDASTFVTICEDRPFCDVPPGRYNVINLTSETRFEDIVVNE